MHQENTAELLEVFRGLSRALRYCCRNEAFCEGVTFHQFIVLEAAAGRKALQMADLHRILNVEKSTTTRLVNPLIAKGLLRREKTDGDARAVKLALTLRGEATRKKVLQCLGGFSRRVLDNIPREKRTAVLEAVKIFIAAVNHSESGGHCCS
ncbi:MAG TPA: MarR family winged helix-turn-helix transcriptional regulator [Smithella sp.]|nr:MarR family winged helix-turn-helix transcriptional regulator [Smithella sp.]